MDANTAPSGSKGASSNAATVQHQMSIDEAHLILNAKKEDPMEIIQKVRLVMAIFCLSPPLISPTVSRPFLPRTTHHTSTLAHCPLMSTHTDK